MGKWYRTVWDWSPTTLRVQHDGHKETGWTKQLSHLLEEALFEMRYHIDTLAPTSKL
jgi:hypothetical protein